VELRPCFSLQRRFCSAVIPVGLLWAERRDWNCDFHCSCDLVLDWVHIYKHMHLVSVISVLEDPHGIKAVIKSRRLIKGKMGVAVAIFFTVAACFVGVELLYENFVVASSSVIE
jgi:hypothetical protein